jgi:glucosamine--fructose-6-phosphate aminotransferase (isomerizing)
MCGIVGYVGRQEAMPVLTEGLRRLEYRGYDSAGIAVHRADKLAIYKACGKVREVIGILPKRIRSQTGIGHTRWATHGVPNDVNAHPHCDNSKRIAVVHNGIIENAVTLREQLLDQGVNIVSDTDSELLAHLIAGVDAERLDDAVRTVLRSITGTYGIAAIDTAHPHEIVVARNGSPVILGIGHGESFVASDSAALVRYTQKVVYLEDGEVARLTASGYEVTTLDAAPIARAPAAIEVSDGSYDKAEHAHFMVKEIHEQPECIRRALRGRLDKRFHSARLDGLNLSANELLGFKRVKVIGCGSAYIAGVLGAKLVEHLARIPVDAEAAAEFRYRNPIIEQDTLYLAVSQSGETLDTLIAIDEIQRKGGTVRGIINVVGSSIARKCAGGIYLHAGPEIAVVSTKTFVSTLIAFTLLALFLGRMRDLSPAEGRRLIEALETLPDLVGKLLARESDYRNLAAKYARYEHAYFIGRNYGYALAMEGALKLKEVSYIHAEAYPASELKHGPIALVTESTPTVVLVPNDDLVERNLASIEEIKARQGPVLLITQAGERGSGVQVDDEIPVPVTHELLSPVAMLIPLQFLAYFAALERNCDVDQPRNLAKSVTVE